MLQRKENMEQDKGTQKGGGWDAGRSVVPGAEHRDGES